MPNHDQSESKHPSEERAILEQIIESETGTIRARVAQEAVDYNHDDPTAMFLDLMCGGCQSGIVGSLIYYCDPHEFFDRYYEDIEIIREEIEDNLGEPVIVKGDLKNFFAWLAFEETASLMAQNDLDMRL